MSTKVEKTANANEDNNQNDWDLDDEDNWDDWGDAEDTVSTEISQHPKESVAQHNAKTPENNNVNKTKEIYVEQQPRNMQNNNIAMKEPQATTKPTGGAAAGGGGGGGWGSLFGGVVSSVLSTATELTSTVTQSLDKVIGVPDPEEMARINASEEARIKSQQQTSNQEEAQQDDQDDERSLTPTKANQAFGLNLVNNVTSLGSKVLNSGLDTLEGIGKKTMHILQDNDPLLKSRIKNFGLEKEKPNLTEVSCNINSYTNVWGRPNI